LLDNHSRLRRAFAVALKLPERDVNDDLRYAGDPAWDSLSHIALIASLEVTFRVILDGEDVLALTSYHKAREILSTHGIKF
jgi:acyl carrier protein